jgi:pentatricopeptide repeat protein
MEELTALRHCLENRDYEAALRIVEEMEEMSREDKINKIGSFIKVLLIHLIKQHAENRTTRSWEASIFNALFEIRKTNQRRKSGGRYMSDAEMLESIEAHYPAALRYAALEAFGGRYDEAEIEQMFSPDELKQAALDMIAADPS